MFEDRVCSIIATQAGIPVEEVRPGRSLGHDIRDGEDPIDLDSLDRIELAMKLEDAFEIEIKDDQVDLPELGTVHGLCAYIERRMRDTPLLRQPQQETPSYA